jgi:hypothetical protein
MKPIHKFNNGKGATLCYCCSKIITIGLTEELFCCKQCEAKHRSKMLMFLKQMDNEVHKDNNKLNK